MLDPFTFAGLPLPVPAGILGMQIQRHNVGDEPDAGKYCRHHPQDAHQADIHSKIARETRANAAIFLSCMGRLRRCGVQTSAPPGPRG